MFKKFAWVVYKEQGEYSDYRVTIITLFDNETAAQDFVDEANRKATECNKWYPGDSEKPVFNYMKTPIRHAYAEIASKLEGKSKNDHEYYRYAFEDFIDT